MPIQKSNTVVSTIGGATAPATFVVLNPEYGARSVDGSEKTITDNRDTAETCNVGDICKYIHLFAQCSPRQTATDDDDRTGWLEWAFCIVKETETTVPITQLGVLTLGNVCTNMFRNECIYTGNFPVGNKQPNSMEAYIKIPKFKQKIVGGDEWRFITYFRDAEVTSTAGAAVRLIKSYMYKAYQ